MMIRFGGVPAATSRRGLHFIRRRSAAKRSCARATIASSAGSRGTAALGGTQLLRGVAEVPGLGGRGLAALELLPAAVDPDHGDVHLQQRDDVGVVAARDVNPALL